ncbi:MAG: Response regulator receiver protein [uncultured bacterium]|nr:MAG: Response regulator receiver protein [uncultured bacterium]
MKILIAEDDYFSRQLLQSMLGKWGHEVIAAQEGNHAWDILTKEDAPKIAILDWMMPNMDGVEICAKLRATYTPQIPTYIILLTAKGGKEDIVKGLEAGADDYITKPFDPDELRVRVHVGQRLLKLQMDLCDNIKNLEAALVHVKQLQGLLPICSYCKKIRDQKNYWHQVESYIASHSEANFSHGFCPDCYDKHVKPQLEKLRNKQQAGNIV